MITLEQIELEMLQGDILPHRLGELRVLLSAKFAQAMNELENVLRVKPGVWNEMRGNFRSDTACERAWSGMELGQKELHWKFQLKKMEKMMSALKTLWEITNTEIRNLT